jgi:aerobic carbon-monoxide dehydrogenase medium subunit
MKPAPFEYVRPASLAQALETLHQRGDDAKVLAGGQSLVPMMNFRLARPAVIVDLNGLGDLAYIRPDNGGLAVGAMTRQRTIEKSAVVRARAPLLADATPWIGHLPIRTRGTIGGSLVHADPAAEYPVVMVALDAEFALARQGGTRRVTAADFFETYLTTTIGPDEILTEIRLPGLPQKAAVAFLEISRRHGDFAIVAAAAVVDLDARGQITEARIALGGVGPKPVRARAAERLLAGQRPTAALLAEAARAVMPDTDPPEDIHASAEYRREMSAVFTRRALTAALGKLGAQL